MAKRTPHDSLSNQLAELAVDWYEQDTAVWHAARAHREELRRRIQIAMNQLHNLSDALTIRPPTHTPHDVWDIVDIIAHNLEPSTPISQELAMPPENTDAQDISSRLEEAHREIGQMELASYAAIVELRLLIDMIQRQSSALDPEHICTMLLIAIDKLTPNVSFDTLVDSE
jgi:hypothetical protein